ncbi:hypothetical protein [Calothrix rhizosoleniae]|uniref:hypothetical protein n=1 Tax=Calothrix rhizosoleniae TaxID=888997 RepID=UPI000B4A2C70|nr:hypothetical protein [Calothrix rhizosoleniae]
MSVNVDTQRTSRFVEPWPYVALGSSALVFMALIASPFFKRTLVSKNVSVSTGKPVKLKEFTLKPQPIGALRVDAEAWIRTNQWVTYEIQLLDQQGKLIASAVKQAWKESGRWYEDGESGTWAEQDLKGGLDVRVKKEEKVTLAINVLGYGAGRSSINLPVPFKVKVENGVVDTRHLWPGFFGSLALGVMAYLSIPQIGKQVIKESLNDSDPSGRGTVGGANRLVRVNVDVKSDETSPKELEVRLFINNSYGEQVYTTSEVMKLNFKKEDGKIEGASGNVQKFFLFDVQDSYGFQVEVLPDSPVDRTILKVKDGARTRHPVDVVYIHGDSVDRTQSQNV